MSPCRPWLAACLVIAAACGGAARSGPPAPPPKPPAPPLTEEECSRLFTRFFALMTSNPIAEVGNADFRLSFVEQCPTKLERVQHFDCGMKAGTRDELLGCGFPPIEPEAAPATTAAPPP